MKNVWMNQKIHDFVFSPEDFALYTAYVASSKWTAKVTTTLKKT